MYAISYNIDNIKGLAPESEDLTMKYSEAIKAAKQDKDFAAHMESFKKHIEETHGAGSIQFSFAGNYCEAFYWSVENYFDYSDGQYHTLIEGGKHTPERSAYLIKNDRTVVLPHVVHKIVLT